MKVLNKRVGELIREARKACGIKTQSELAEILGVEPATVSRWEAGIYAPGPEIEPALFEALHINEDFFRQGIRGPSAHGTKTMQEIANTTKGLNDDERAQIVADVMDQLKKTFIKDSVETLREEVFQFKNNPKLNHLFSSLSKLSDRQLSLIQKQVDLFLEGPKRPGPLTKARENK